MDYPLNKTTFLRTSFLYGIGFGNKFEDEPGDEFKKNIGSNVDVSTIMSHGINVKIGVGFKF
jgi:hypothetical protein